MLLQQPEQVPVPHVHAPLEHDSPEEHVPQAAPPVPQAAADWDAYGTQVLPLQQPFGQDVASHTHVPLAVSHCCPGTWGQAAQVAPPVPHELVDSLP